MKKLVLRLCQSILRRLVTSASTGTPWTSKVSVPPTPTPKYFAASSSTDTRGRAAASLGFHQCPPTMTVAGGGGAPPPRPPHPGREPDPPARRPVRPPT